MVDDKNCRGKCGILPHLIAHIKWPAATTHPWLGPRRKERSWEDMETHVTIMIMKSPIESRQAIHMRLVGGVLSSEVTWVVLDLGGAPGSAWHLVLLSFVVEVPLWYVSTHPPIFLHPIMYLVIPLDLQAPSPAATHN